MKRRTSGTTVWGRLATKERWSEADARVLVDAWRESGQSIEAFAREVGTGAWRLRYWVPRLAGGAEAASALAGDAQRFVPAVVAVGANERSPRIVVRLPDGIEVELHDVAQVEADEIARLVASLRRAST